MEGLSWGSNTEFEGAVSSARLVSTRDGNGGYGWQLEMQRLATVHTSPRAWHHPFSSRFQGTLLPQPAWTNFTAQEEKMC
jgi:hypothetical protein